MMEVVRTQLQLTEEQARVLRSVAAQRGCSMAAVIRELIEEGLRTPASARAVRARAAIGRFASGAQDVSVEHDRELEHAYGQ